MKYSYWKFFEVLLYFIKILLCKVSERLGSKLRNRNINNRKLHLSQENLKYFKKTLLANSIMAFVYWAITNAIGYTVIPIHISNYFTLDNKPQILLRLAKFYNNNCERQAKTKFWMHSLSFKLTINIET